ncbi:granulocyte-macrophage colony-stimulating factor receptor subunit alpha-like isoform X2 [Lithobates pipiens]
MKMEKLSYLLVLISLWFLLELTHSEKEISLLPTNMKIHLYPGLIHITWDCNITESMKDYKYDITFQNAADKTITLSDCFYDYCIPKHMDFDIHHGLHIEVFVKNKSDTIDTFDTTDIIETKELTAMPEGKENTAAENFACVVYNVSIVNCSWTAGREAPKDTNYSLAIRNSKNCVPCEDYRHDSFGRQVGCVLKSPPNIDFSADNYIQLVGSSEETSIRFYDARLKLNNYVILDPPRNINLNYSMNNLEITWEKPETYNWRDNCFVYEIKINEGDNIEIAGEQNSYKAAILLDNENLSVSMRVKWKESCSDNKNWSRWSEPIIYCTGYGRSYFQKFHSQQ